MTASPTDEWRHNVHALLGDGLGVEDIGNILECPADDVRAEVKSLREAGELNAVLGIEV